MFDHRKLAGAFAASLAAGSLLAANAAAGPADLRAPDNVTPAVTQVAPTDLRSPDAVDAASPAVQAPATKAPSVDLRSPDAVDAANPAVQVVQTGGSSSGFDWGDAGIGAGGAVAVGLLILGGTMLITRRRHPVETPTAPLAG
jgi:hypothetical protein